MKFPVHRANSALETLNSYIEYTIINLLIGLDRGMDLFLTVEAPILGNLVLVLDARAEDKLCDC